MIDDATYRAYIPCGPIVYFGCKLPKHYSMERRELVYKIDIYNEGK
jgi:hypothetical protein